MKVVFEVDRSNVRFLHEQFSLESTTNYVIVIMLTILFSFVTPYLAYLQDIMDTKHSTACRAVLTSSKSKRNKLLGRIGILIARCIVIFFVGSSISTLDIGLVISAFVGFIVGYSLTCWFRETRGTTQGRIEGGTLPRSTPPYLRESSPTSSQGYPPSSPVKNPSSTVNVQKYPAEYPRKHSQ
jgi:hypothetical protein